jgi:long-chain acyl-CoA synthetase
MANLYEQKVWLKLYPERYPSDFQAPNISAIDVFNQCVSRHPQAPAIHYFDGTLAYGELDSLANSMAAGLSDLGVVKGDRVILHLQNIPQFLIAHYACWKLGAIVVPLNPMYKERELQFYCSDSGAKVLITMESCYPEARGLMGKTPLNQIITASELDFLPSGYSIPSMLKGSKKEKIRETLDFVNFLNKHQGAGFTKAKVKPQDVAYLHYTSGTTGTPKGAMNTHANVVFCAHVFRMAYDINKEDKLLGIAPFIHITGTIDYLALGALLGIPIIAFFRFDPGEALRLAEKWKATFTISTLTAFISLLDHPDLSKRDISSLKKVASGGASVAEAFLKRFEQATGIYIHNAYGLTESTSPAIYTPLGVRGPVDRDTNALSIGFPLPGITARIIEVETGADLPPGETGEILVKGPNVIPGYWNKPEETAKAIKDGWLYTGDIGKMDENGWFYIVDRKKDMINVSGFKVWPREVEDVLYMHPAVKEACVIGVPDSYRGETVKAFIILKESYQGEVTPEELIQFCRSRMAAYKSPRIVEITTEIPKTLTGKMLKRQLREEEVRKRN